MEVVTSEGPHLCVPVFPTDIVLLRFLDSTRPSVADRPTPNLSFRVVDLGSGSGTAEILFGHPFDSESLKHYEGKSTPITLVLSSLLWTLL